jgi:hypothetical protein
MPVGIPVLLNKSCQFSRKTVNLEISTFGAMAEFS